MNKLTNIATLAGAFVLGPAALLGSSAASAATISYDSAGALHYDAAPGETNRAFFQGDSGTLIVSDADGVPLEDTSGNCQPGYVSYVVECTMPSGIVADLGDGADRFGTGSGLPASLPIAARGGDGKDQLKTAASTYPVTFDGGTGDDEIIGGEGGDVLNGGPGADTIDGRGAADRIDAGDGNDLLNGDGHNTEHGADVIEGGPGYDRIENEWMADESGSPQPPVNITFGGGADDGFPGEGDDVRGVESIFMYAAGTYVGTDAAEKIQVHQITEPSTIRANGGDDDIDLSDGDDDVDGGAGNDVLDGGFGNDHIVGGPGADRLHGDTPEGECSYIYCKNAFGNDTIDARDGEVDQIDCGVGSDRAIVDAVDVVAANCETIERSAGSGPAGSGASVGSAGAKGPTMVVKLPGRLRAALRDGLVVRLTGMKPGALTVQARRAGKLVALGRVDVGRSGSATARVRFMRSARRSLARRKLVVQKIKAGPLSRSITIKR
jgi:hypothetical protein